MKVLLEQTTNAHLFQLKLLVYYLPFTCMLREKYFREQLLKVIKFTFISKSFHYSKYTFLKLVYEE